MIKSSISKKVLREFGILIGFCFPIIIGWLFPALGGHPFRVWTLWLGIPFFILSLLKPFLLFYPYKGWMLIGHYLGWINSRIILGLVYITILLPIALVMKTFKYDPLRKNRFDKKSYRENVKGRKINFTRIF